MVREQQKYTHETWCNNSKSTDQESNWYLLQAKPKQHEKALRNLLSQDYECYSPNITLKKCGKDNKELSVVEPLFPGYIFIRLEYDCNWMAISSTRGVNKFVKFGIYPTIVSPHVIYSISQSIDGFSTNIKNLKELRFGDTVTICMGAFDGFEAIYKCSLGTERSIVLINYLQKVHEISVRNEMIKKVSQG